jgi:hypothetical protein
VAYFSDRGDGALAYRRQGADGGAVAAGRLLPGGAPAQPEVVISRPDAGAVVAGTLRAGGDRVGDLAVAMLQQSAAGRTLTVALQDIAPGRPRARSRYVSPRIAGIAWGAGLDYLGPQTFHVRVDGREVGTTTGATRLRTTRVRDGRHRLQIVAVDRRGQRTPGSVTTIYADSRAPHASASASRAGRALTVAVQASDPGGSGSGVRSYAVDWGDGHRSTSRRPVLRHRYGSAGRKRIVVTVGDRAGNQAVKRLRA